MNLSDGWKMRYEDLETGPEYEPMILQKQDGWYDIDLPCDVHIPLIKNGVIKEPLEGNNFSDCEWIENKSWWFKKSFDIANELLEADAVELTFEMLDLEADIFLNGMRLGHQKSSFYPFTRDVKKFLRPVGNTLLVRLTCGAEYCNKNDTVGTSASVQVYDIGNRGDARRHFLRKPQYTYGWDFGPRLATCGITGDVKLEPVKCIAIRSVHTVTEKLEANTAYLRAEIEVENLKQWSTTESRICIEMLLGSRKVISVEKDTLLKSGFNYIEFNLKIENALLWWPNGMGEQPLYTVKVSANTENIKTSYKEFKIGIRTLQLDVNKVEDGRSFTFIVNGIKMFCKGGNWAPADAIYSRVTPEKYNILISEAAEANFNMLRVWGGGIYEKDVFYEKCNQYGILIWHDFMFACATYPDNLEWFRKEVENEIDYQTRRLRNHPSIAIWSGCNENQWLYPQYYITLGVKFFGGAECYNHIAPRLVHKNCPQIPYWNGSPYGGERPNGDYTGDCHYWLECFMDADMEKRIRPEEYDTVTAKFISEYGYIGPCRKKTTLQYMGGHAPDRSSDIWKSHNNWFEKGVIEPGISRHYTEAAGLDIDSYLLYAGLCHGLMYQYSLEAFRFKPNCSGGLFWMYTDVWGEVGWSIMDYYLRRKIPYYFVKRTLSHVKLIMRADNEVVKVVGINDTPEDVTFDAMYGYARYDGKNQVAETANIKINRYSRQVVLEFKKGVHDFNSGCCFIKPKNSAMLIEQAVLRTSTFKEMKLSQPKLSVSNITKDKGKIVFDVSCDVYAHAVHFNLGDEIKLSDEYFDLMPGDTKRIEILNPDAKFSVSNIKPLCVYIS